MAGGAWVTDIILHTAIMAGKCVFNFWRQWSVELLLGISLVMQLVLSLLAGLRWRGAPKALRLIIWLVYVGADYVATTALGNLSIRDSSDERQLITLWAPFFLLHLGGPDNITAYEFEDNQLSMRAVLQLVVQVAGTLLVVYYSTSGSWALILATSLMFFVCVIKNVERTLALYRANLDNIRSSLKLKKGRHHHRRKLTFAAGDDSALLMKAHSLFHICKHALVGSLVGEELDDDEAEETRKDFRDLKWFQLFEVIEMELSLMYEFLYTKASVIYTWHGYGIRALSPLAALASSLLVELSINHGHVRHRQSDVVITRVLLAATFILEMVSLLRALGSSWTGSLIWKSVGPAWLRHQFICNNRWHRFRRAMASIGLIAKVVKDHMVSDLHEEEYRVTNHRRWSGNIGQLNLFQRVTCGPLEKEQNSFWTGTQEHIKPDVKKVVYRKVRHTLFDFRKELKEMIASSEYAIQDMKLSATLSTKRGQTTLKAYGLEKKLRPSLGSELQVGILVWHIGTNIFLNISDKAKAKGEVAHQVEAVRTLSNYMMHLLCERPHLLPDVVTLHLLERTRRDLVEIWNNPEHAAMKVGEITSREGQLAGILVRRDFKSELINEYLDEAIRLAIKLLSIADNDEEFSKAGDTETKGIVEVILEVWVDMLFHASYRCSKESHAKQLAYGGELTTVVWLLAEHVVSLFLIPKKLINKGEPLP